MAKATHKVWNVTQEYVEHLGSLSSCQTWVNNVRGMGFTQDVFRIVPNVNVPDTKKGR